MSYTNWSKTNYIEDKLNGLKLYQENQQVISPNLSKEQVYEITLLEKKVIMLENDKEYLGHTLSEKDVELKTLQEKLRFDTILLDSLRHPLEKMMDF